MQIVTLPSGLLSYVYSDKERNATWDLLMTETDPCKTGETLYTPKDNLSYKIIQSEYTNAINCTITVEANNKIKKFKATLYNEHEKTYKAVRSLYK